MKKQVGVLSATPSKRLFLSIIGKATWKKITHYSDLRNKLIHQRATAGISDDELEDFREIVEFILKKLYKLKFQVPDEK